MEHLEYLLVCIQSELGRSRHLLQLQDDRPHSRDVLRVPRRLGVEVAQLGDALPLRAGLDLVRRRLELLLGGLGRGAIRGLQLAQLMRRRD